MAAFQWADFSAGFACSSTQADGTFSDFKINKDSREGGMEEIENVVVGLLDDVTDGKWGEIVVCGYGCWI